MKKRVFVADIRVMKKTVALFCLWTSCAAAQDAQLVGRWRSVETSKGGIGAMYDFMANGTVQFSPGAIVPEPYRVEGERLTIGAPQEMQYTIAFTGEDRLRMSVNGQGEEYTRLGTRPNPQSLLVGEWTGTRDMSGVKTLVHWIFRADSTTLLMIRFTTQSGTYSAQNGHLKASFGGRGDLEGTLELTGGVLSITRSPGRVTKLMRY